MVHKGVRPNHFTYPSVLKACAEQSTLDFGREVHKSIDASSLRWDLFVQNSLVSMYAKCGDLETSRCIFETMPTRDQVSWNSIISGYAYRDLWDEAFKIFERMRATRTDINIITWNTVAGGRELHGSAIQNASIDYDNVKNALITMYSSGTIPKKPRISLKNCCLSALNRIS
ncbi:Pentatricopeptide repeat-containing protein [Striga hermonthica]|uniref:Pentatricopeptide repeat-containing protein n=1 Tax=Striga hermonthica TaxID=68872 RepID=A0A9N7MZB3_STRHE|nr:Pentatricopeptide repeat-containing protein [Striga hermonthica]